MSSASQPVPNEFPYEEGEAPSASSVSMRFVLKNRNTVLQQLLFDSELDAYIWSDVPFVTETANDNEGSQAG